MWTRCIRTFDFYSDGCASAAVWTARRREPSHASHREVPITKVVVELLTADLFRDAVHHPFVHGYRRVLCPEVAQE